MSSSQLYPRQPRPRPRRRRRRAGRILAGGGILVATAVTTLLVLLNVDIGTARPDPARFSAPTTASPTTAPPMTTPPTTDPPAPPPTVPVPTKAAPAPVRSEALQANVLKAVSVGKTRGERVAVAVYDRKTGQLYTGGDATRYYASASVMKVFIATRLLVGGQSRNPSTAALMRRMITLSDDSAADQLYPLAGGSSVVPWVARTYQLDGIAATTDPQYWGLTRISAAAMVKFYDAVANDSRVGPWLLDAMGGAQPKATDGFAQLFGLPAATGNWRVKQGWMCCLDSLTRMHSTGFVGADRYTVALLTEGGRDVYGDYGAKTLTQMAKALLPSGRMPD